MNAAIQNVEVPFPQAFATLASSLNNTLMLLGFASDLAENRKHHSIVQCATQLFSLEHTKPQLCRLGGAAIHPLPILESRGLLAAQW